MVGAYLMCGTSYTVLCRVSRLVLVYFSILQYQAIDTYEGDGRASNCGSVYESPHMRGYTPETAG